MNHNNDKKPDRPDFGPNNPTPKEDATELMLVAYLDGELEEAERKELQSRLDSDPVLRRRLEQLRQAWDLLDELEACPPSRRFAETTLEMVALDAESHLMAEEAKKRRKLKRRRNWTTLGLFVSLLAGFALIWFLYPKPDAILIKNLPVIAKLDQYESAESVAFLEALVEAKLFPLTADTDNPNMTPEPTAEASATLEEPTLEQAPPIPGSSRLRREWIEQLEPVQKAQLLQHWERFERLSHPQRRKIVTLHEQLATAKQSELLTTVMSEYNDWFRRQPSFTRTGLLDLSASDRIAMLRSLRHDELDRLGLYRWLQANRARLSVRMAEIRQSPEARLEPLQQQGRWRTGPGLGLGPGPGAGMGPGHEGRESIENPGFLAIMLRDDDLADLKKNYLSPETAKELENKPSNAQRLWVGQMFYRMALERGMERRISAGSDSVTDEELAKFFEQLTPKQQTELFNTPGDQLLKKLMELYPKDSQHRGRREGRPNEPRGANHERRGRGPAAMENNPAR